MQLAYTVTPSVTDIMDSLEVPEWVSALPDFDSHTACYANGVVLEAADYGNGPCWMAFNVCGELVADGEAPNIGEAKDRARAWYAANVERGTDVMAHA